MGLLHVDPKKADLDTQGRSALLVAPVRADTETLAAISEWAASSQAPIFCLPKDIERLEADGFGNYRFLKLDGYREVDFQGGTLEFFPAKRVENRSGLQVVARQILSQLGLYRSDSFHVRIWPERERPVLVLAHANLDAVEATVLRGTEKPSLAIVLDNQSDSASLERLSRALGGVAIKRRNELSGLIETMPSDPSLERSRRREIGLWAASGDR